MIELLTAAVFAYSQPSVPDSKLDWWRDSRFGMFIHWGLYAVPAGMWKDKGTGHAEWIRTTAQIPLEEYDEFVPEFNPVNFDADAWCTMANDAGMGYVVITTKHHDGFCLFDTKETAFNTVNSPYGKDLMAELAEACHRRHFTLGFYYSIRAQTGIIQIIQIRVDIMSWTHSREMILISRSIWCF